MTTTARTTLARPVALALAAMALAAMIALTPGAPAQAADKFSDVPDGHQFDSQIEWLADMRVTTGYADGTFRPRDSVTREAFAAFLYRLAGSPIVSTPSRSPFKDVPTSAKFYDEIVWLDQQRITNGWSDGTFRPKQQISREAIAAFLYRLSGRPSHSAPSRSPFSDMTTRSNFYKEITWLADTGITTGWSDGTFRPKNDVSREAIAAFLYRGSSGMRGTGNHVYTVGEDIFPGTYVATAQHPSEPLGCYWERRTNTGVNNAGIIGSDYGPIRAIATIEPGDPYFAPRTCGTWTPLRATSPRATSFGDGFHATGHHMRPGTYRAPGGSECSWWALDSFSGEYDDIVADDDGTHGSQTVRLRAGQSIHTYTCGTWTRIGS